LKLIDENIFTNKSFNKNDFILETISAPSQDGELVPMTIFHKKNLKKNRKNKTLFIAYGSYGLNLELNFNVVHLAAAELGWVIVFCHVRGGGEKGQNWHFDGKLLNKSNSINDYLSCIYHLVQCGYTHPNYIAGYGTSSGGLLVGQSANIAPELFRAICLSHPFVDVLSTLIDKDLPLTIPDYEEYGNPLENKEDYFNILSFSPYENISIQEYPG
jgi:oligopeptidase B